MNLRQIAITIFVSFLLACGQLFTKMGLNKIDLSRYEIKNIVEIIGKIVTSGNMWLGVLFTLGSMVLWLKILSEVNLSIAYPLISFSYVFGLILSVVVLGENVPLARWDFVFSQGRLIQMKYLHHSNY